MPKSFCAKKYKKVLISSNDINTCPKVPLPKISEHQNYIFISYSHKDYKYVYSDLADLYEAGVRFWYDSGLSAGKKWDEEVFEKITNSHCVGVVFYMSENLFLSKSAGREIEIAHNRHSENVEKNQINYFAVNLTEKLPKELFISAIKEDVNNTLDMKQISILSQAFPDNATYIYYHSPEHKKQILTQIKDQFGVINDIADLDPLDIDTDTCEIFIGSIERTNSPDRKNLINDLKTHLEAFGKSVYVSQDVQEISAKDSLNNYLNEYIEKQNSIKLNSSACVIFISSLLGWGLLSSFLGELDNKVIPSKKILYLIASPSSDANYFIKLYNIDTQNAIGQDIMQRVLFLDNYKEQIKKLL